MYLSHSVLEDVQLSEHISLNLIKTLNFLKLIKTSSSLLTFLVLSSLGGYVRRQAPGTEKKTALKVKLDTNHISVHKSFALH